MSISLNVQSVRKVRTQNLKNIDECKKKLYQVDALPTKIRKKREDLTIFFIGLVANNKNNYFITILIIFL